MGTVCLTDSASAPSLFFCCLQKTPSVTMAAQFAGKWDLQSAENAADLLAKTGVANEFLTLAKQMAENQDAIVEDIAVDGDKITVTYYKNGNKEDSESFTVGQEAESDTVDGRKVKFCATVEGNKLISKESGPYELTSTFEVNGSDAKATVECGGVTATAVFKKL